MDPMGYIYTYMYIVLQLYYLREIYIALHRMNGRMDNGDPIWMTAIRTTTNVRIAISWSAPYQFPVVQELVVFSTWKIVELQCGSLSTVLQGKNNIFSPENLCYHFFTNRDSAHAKVFEQQIQFSETSRFSPRPVAFVCLKGAQTSSHTTATRNKSTNHVWDYILMLWMVVESSTKKKSFNLTLCLQWLLRWWKNFQFRRGSTCSTITARW